MQIYHFCRIEFIKLAEMKIISQVKAACTAHKWYIVAIAVLMATNVAGLWYHGQSLKMYSLNLQYAKVSVSLAKNRYIETMGTNADMFIIDELSNAGKNLAQINLPMPE